MLKKIFGLLFVGFFFFPLASFANMNSFPSGLAVNQLEGTVDRVMQKYIGKEIPGAAIAIVKDGEVLLLKGYGKSDIERNVPVDPEKTVFEAGSVSKLYTWSAVMQLVERGKLDLDADIREYLPANYLELAFDKKITMLHLMNHTAGFEDKSDQLLTRDRNKIVPLEEFLSKSHQQPKQMFRPGTVTSYSNFGTSLAGYIVERVSGKHFPDYMKKHVLDRLGMKQSTFDLQYDEIPKIANNKGEGYQKKGDRFEAMDWVYVNDAPAGSLNTTAADMARFMMAQLGSEKYRLFEHSYTLKKMHETTYQMNEYLPGNAHGFWERYSNGHRLLEHGGNVVGYTSQLTLVPEEKIGIALLMNVANEMTGLRVDLINALIGKNTFPDTISHSKNDSIVQGTYRMARGVYTNFLKFLPVMGNGDVVIKKHDQGGIELNTGLAPKPIRYTETSPLLYERVDDTVSLLDKSGLDTSYMAFELDDGGNVLRMTHGVVSDYLPVKGKDRITTNLIIIVMSVLTFTFYPLVFGVRWLIIKLKKKPATKQYRAAAVLSCAGLLTVVNLTLLLTRYISDSFQPLVPLRIHIWINWLFPITTAVCAYFIFKHFKQVNPAGKITHIFLIAVCCAFTFFLINFQFL